MWVDEEIGTATGEDGDITVTVGLYDRDPGRHGATLWTLYYGRPIVDTSIPTEAIPQVITHLQAIYARLSARHGHRHGHQQALSDESGASAGCGVTP